MAGSVEGEEVGEVTLGLLRARSGHWYNVAMNEFKVDAYI